MANGRKAWSWSPPGNAARLGSGPLKAGRARCLRAAATSLRRPLIPARASGVEVVDGTWDFHLMRGLLLLTAVFVGALATASVSTRGSVSAQGIDPELYAPWNSPVAEARANRGLEASPPRRAYHAHGYDDGLRAWRLRRRSRSRSATPTRPVNILEIIDPAPRTGWRIAHPHPRVGLMDPAFSPEGDRLAFVVGLPSAAGEFTGVSAIWIVDREGQVERVVSTPAAALSASRLSRRPTASGWPSCARDVLRTRRRPRPLPPENQSAKPMSLFETDLESGRERQLSEERYAAVHPVAYEGSGGALLFQAGARLVPLEAVEALCWGDGSGLLAALPPPPAPLPLALLRLNLADRSISDAGPALAPIPGRGPGAVLGLTDRGGVVLFDTALEGEDHLDWSIYEVDRAQARCTAARPRAALRPGGRCRARGQGLRRRHNGEGQAGCPRTTSKAA